MTDEPIPHVVTVAEHSVYDAVCVTCPWTAEGFLDPTWAEMAKQQHEKGHSVARETNEEEA